MADSPEKTDKTSDASAEKAYAEAASQVKAAAAEKALTKKAPAKKAPTKKAPAKKTPVAKSAAKPAAPEKAPVKKMPVKKMPVKKTAATKAPVKKVAASESAPVVKAPEAAPAPAPAPEAASEIVVETAEKATEAAADVVEAVAESATPVAKKPTRRAKAAAKPRRAPARKKAATRPSAPIFAKKFATTPPTISELKEMIMATKTTDITDAMTKSMSDAVSELQGRAQAAYDKSTGFVSEITGLAKGNAEAFVESGKILSGGVQDMGKILADEAKSAYETATADMKEIAAIKSPTELFQLQGKIMRRNFDSLIANTSKNSEAAMKLMNDTFAPITARVNTSVETFSKVA